MPSANEETILEAFKLARRADHRQLRLLLHDDVTWHPAATAKWNPCKNADDVVRTLLWRAEANRLRPGETIDLGDRVLVHLRGRRVERLGARGLVPRLFQILVVRDGKIASIQDYGRRADAYTAAGLTA
ncbi:MAG TPA: nuclear transport factor 2 family protein [Gaiellaceae bacterium]|jgi:ketosteroid isomerase-like protein